MARPSNINHLVFRKFPEKPDHTLRDRLYAFAKDGENVTDLINRAVEAGLGNRRQVRAALYLGNKAKGSKFRLMEVR